MMHRLLFVLFFIVGISFPALAHEPKGIAKKINFSEMKKSKLEQLDNMRACISKSKNLKQLRACKPKWKNKSS